MRAKRAFDLIVSAVLIVALAPLLALIAIAVRSDGGPALYRGVRVGRNGITFRMLKFRTMVPHAERLGGTSTAADDARLTRVGIALRRIKLDELPQLFNVVIGQMSLVGPRPQVAHDVELYTPKERALLDVAPGMTDYASIRFRNEGEILEGSADADDAYKVLIRPEKVRLGLEYVRTRSMAVDLKILALTALAIVNQRAAARALPQPR